MKLNIVMVEPEIPQNTGNIARTCAIIGAKLHLVYPLGFVIDDKKLKRSGLDYWDKLDIEYHDSLDSFLNKYKPEEKICFMLLLKVNIVILMLIIRLLVIKRYLFYLVKRVKVFQKIYFKSILKIQLGFL